MRCPLLLLTALTATASAEPLFNGADLTGWEGNPRVWSVVDGAIRGQTTLAHPAFRNTFLIWKGGALRDFDLRVKVRLHRGNSGIQYRAKDRGGWVVSGYQAEIANEPGAAGFLYEEKGRKFLACLGEKVRIDPRGRREVYGQVASRAQYQGWPYYRPGEWNDYRIVANGAFLAHYVNGFQTIELIDEDAGHRASEGVLALQIHAGLPMTVEFKDFSLQLP